jgi:hypothetical protein
MLTRILIAALTLLLSFPAAAQFSGGFGAGGFVSPPVASGAAYAGPGDVYGTAIAWWGLRAFSGADKGNALINICDPTNTTCADWSSSATTGLLLVGTNPLNGTDCTAVTTCTVKTMYDRSGATNCGGGAAACNVSQNTAADRPTFNWNSGNPYLTCGGTSQLTTFSSSVSATNNQPYSASWVAIRTSGTSAAVVLNYDNRGIDSGFGTANTINMYAGGTDRTFSATDNNWYATQMVFNAASSTAYINGTGPTTASGSPGTANLASGNYFQICKDLGGNQALTGRVREGGWWAGAVSSGNQATVDTQQRAVWGF